MSEEFDLFGKLQRNEGLTIEDWNIQKLREICRFEYGEGLTEDQREGGKYPVYGSAGIVGYHSESYVDKKGVITARKGSIGEVSYSNTPFFPIDTTYYISEDETEENLRWIYYLLDLLDLNRVNASTSIPSLNRDDAGSLSVPVPPRDEQERIASVLYTVDSKVEVLNERYDKLTRLKQALMQDLLTGQTRVTPEIEPIQNFRLDENNISIEEENTMEKIGKYFELVNGQKPEPIKDEGKYPYLNVDYLTGSSKTYTNDESVPLAEQTDTLMIVDGSRSGKVFRGERGAISSTMSALKPKENIVPEYLYQILDFQYNRINAATIGSSIPHADKELVRNLSLFIPPLWEQERIASVLYTVDEMLAKTDDLIEKHTDLKRGLMQDLLSGDVRTPDGLEVVEEVK